MTTAMVQVLLALAVTASAALASRLFRSFKLPRPQYLAAWSCIVFCAACGRSSDAASIDSTRTIRVVGSSTIAPLAGELGRLFEATHPGARIDVEMGGSTRGVVEVRAGQADIGMVSRVLRADEGDLLPFPCGRDGVAMIVHSGLGVTELAREQILSIYRGATTNWREVGGPDLGITVVNKAEGRSTLELFLHHFQLKSQEVRASVVIGDNQQGIKSVASIPGAIGYVSIGAAEAAVAESIGIRILPLDGVPATTPRVQDGTYPFARELIFVTKSPPRGLAREFLDYALSPEAAPVVRELHFVPVQR